MNRNRSIDTAPHPDLRFYSARNLAEVAPARWSVMSWSLVGEPVERGLRALTLRLWPSARWATGSHYVFVGYFACRPYHNLSSFCLLARELPRVAGEDVTWAYFENARPPEREVSAHSSVLQRLFAVPRMAREFHRLRPRLAFLEGEVTLCEEHISTALASGSRIALGRAIEEALRVLDEAWDLHYSTTSSLIPARVLQRALGERLLPHWSELEPLVNRPTGVVWNRHFDGALGRTLEGSRFLGFPFYEVADAHEPWKSYARSFTPRPPEERQEPKHDDMPDVVWRMHRRVRLSGIEQLSRAVVDALKAREESKALAMRCLHVFRCALPSLAEAAGVTGDAWAYLRIGELLGPRHRSVLGELSERRRQECQAALAEPMPDELIASGSAVDDAHTEPVHDRSQRSSSGVSPGVVRGVVATLGDAPFDGKLGHNVPVILVCESADASIQTLLPTVAGLITLRGSMLSHVSTLAREYGIPAVVNHPLARTLRTGQHVVLNGSTGEVEVIS